MRKATVAVVGFFFVYVTYGLILSQYDPTIVSPELDRPEPRGFYDYRGVINVHTRASTGSGTLPDVVRAGQEADLDFLIITDLNQFEPEADMEGYHNKLLLLIDGEYSYLDSRLLNIDANSREHLQGPGRSQALFADLLSQRERDPEKGIFILAHPFKAGFSWSGAYPEGLDGIELINLKSLWQGAWLNDKLSFFWTVLVYPFNPKLAFVRLFKMPDEELQLWDQLSRRRKTLAVAGADAESKVRFAFGSQLKLPSYQTLFSIVANHVLLPAELTGNAANDRRKISEALRRGQFYMSLDILANPKGFSAVVKSKKGDVHLMGAEIPFEPDLQLAVQLPKKPLVPFEIVVFKDGQKILSSTSRETAVRIHGPGVYRALVRVIPTFPLPDGKKWIPWIFTNSFYVR